LAVLFSPSTGVLTQRFRQQAIQHIMRWVLVHYVN